MSHKGGRKSHPAALAEDKEKKPTDSPVKEMKKKIAANAEKEKQATDKTDKTVTAPDKTDKAKENTEKVAEKPQNEKSDNKKTQSAEKVDKNAPTDKNAQKTAEKSDKKTDKVADKKVEKPVEKKNEEKKEEPKADKDKPEKPKQNGATNGEANGTADTVSDPDSSEEDLLVIDDQDEVFPELTYDETSDADFEEGAPSRSFTRRSQVKVTKTPETPRPASFKEDDSKEKVMKMNDSLATDRKLRSADSPKRESKIPEPKKVQDSPKPDKTVDLTEDEPEKEGEKSEVEKTASEKNKLEMDVVIEVETIEELRVKTRARVSPYTSRLPPARHDQTTTSMMANYTGNNTTMEMDISESSMLEEPALDDSSYLRGLRGIRGRASYKPLGDLPKLNRSTRSTTTINTSLTETARPTGAVVGRKRKPDDVYVEPLASDSSISPPDLLHEQHKRSRLLDRFSAPFRGFNTRAAAEIVGINTDLPLTAPVASTSSFDPETLKPSDPIAVPLPPPHDRDNKRCIVM